MNSISQEGCLKSRILNRFCYGQCNSFFIPKSEEPEIVFSNTDRVDAFASSDYLTGHFRSCAVCTPKVAEWAVVVLRCPSLTPPFRRKRVRIVRQCKCMALKLDWIRASSSKVTSDMEFATRDVVLGKAAWHLTASYRTYGLHFYKTFQCIAFECNWTSRCTHIECCDNVM